MRYRAAMLLACALVAGAPALSQTPPPSKAIPRTADGHPDFGGFWSSWFLTPLERGKGIKTLVVTKAEAKKIATDRLAKARLAGGGVGVDPDSRWSGVDNLLEINGEYRTSRIIDPPDGKLPLTKAAKKLADKWDKQDGLPPDGPEMRFTSERCLGLAGIPPMEVLPNFNMRQIVQIPGTLVIYSEEGQDTRIIPFDKGHQPMGVAGGPLGDSIARWEGDVAVVETTGMKVEPNGNLIVMPDSKVVERFQLIGPDEILYRFTVEDPAIYTRPWLAEYTLKRSSLPMFEYACHEAEESVRGMLLAARFAEEKKKSKGKAKQRR